uniref:IF rod domain-containing protein n=1 Tax=Eptatretus burgeri TaxID=7764 RepID=A0A8C4Q7R8_EPTBU
MQEATCTGDYKCSSPGQGALRNSIFEQTAAEPADRRCTHIMSRSPSLRVTGERRASGGGTTSRNFSATSWRGSSSSTFGTMHGSAPGGAVCRSNLMSDLQYVNPKMEMQDLNTRLAEYVDKVRILEHSNEDLEVKIKQLLINRNALLEKHLENESIVLKIDNAHLAADDFKSKWDTECGVRNSVASDITNLRTLLDEYTLARTELETDVEAQKDELAYIKKSHAEVKGLALCQGEVEEGELRNEEKAAEENFRKLVRHFDKHLLLLSYDCHFKVGNYFNIGLKCIFLQIEPLELEFANTQNRKERELANFLRVIGRLEGELNTANDEHDRQLRAYSALLNEKMRLEQEIATYRRLLEDEMARSL